MFHSNIFLCVSSGAVSTGINYISGLHETIGMSLSVTLRGLVQFQTEHLTLFINVKTE